MTDLERLRAENAALEDKLKAAEEGATNNYMELSARQNALDESEAKCAALQSKLDGVTVTMRESPAARIKKLEAENIALAELLAVKDKALSDVFILCRRIDGLDMRDFMYARSKTHASVAVAKARMRVVEAAKKIHSNHCCVTPEKCDGIEDFGWELSPALAALSEAEQQEKP